MDQFAAASAISARRAWISSSGFVVAGDDHASVTAHRGGDGAILHWISLACASSRSVKAFTTASNAGFGRRARSKRSGETGVREQILTELRRKSDDFLAVVPHRNARRHLARDPPF